MRKKIGFITIITVIVAQMLCATELIPIPLTVKADQKKVALGKKLFLDPILYFAKPMDSDAFVSFYKKRENDLSFLKFRSVIIFSYGYTVLKKPNLSRGRYGKSMGLK